MNSYPFNSSAFTSIWLKHFSSKKTQYDFDFINHVKFIKSKCLPLYINVGKNITNGISYKLFEEDGEKSYANKVFLIYDVPTYFDLQTPVSGSRLKINKVNQYKGVLANLSEFKDLNEYLSKGFKSKGRNFLKRKIKKKQLLEDQFNISYSVLYGEVSDDQFQTIAHFLRKMISKRFNSLKRQNSIIDSWDYYYELIISMVKSKNAVVVTVEKDNIPIGATFNFLYKDKLLNAITTFDTDYLPFNIGHINIIKALEWCFENNVPIYDFSKGICDYKKKWKSNEYDFQYHVLYDSNSVIASAIAAIISSYFKLKQQLRDLGINLLYSKINFLVKGK